MYGGYAFRVVHGIPQVWNNMLFIQFFCQT